MEELVCYDADIICLQEVDRFDDVIKPKLAAQYDSYYIRRTRAKPDGCATFFKKTKYGLTSCAVLTQQIYTCNETIYGIQ